MPDPSPDKANEDAREDACAALERMAGGDHELPSMEAPQRDETPSVLEPVPVNLAATSSSAKSPASYLAPQKSAQDSSLQLKKVVIPPMTMMVGIMVMLGIWAILALCGYSFLTDEPNEAVDRLAKVMLLCWPVAGLLVAGIVIFKRDIKRLR